MKIQEYYNTKYYGLNQSFPSLLDFNSVKKYLKSNILDVGCGNGGNVKILYKMGFTVFGCDIFEKVNDLGQDFFFMHDFEEEPLSKKFNTITCVHVLEHIFDYISFLKNINKSLKEDGNFILTLPNSYSLTSRIKFLLGFEEITLGVGKLNCVEQNKLEPHLRFFGKETLTKILSLNGFFVKESYVVDSSGIKTPLAGQLVFVCGKK